ncbi:MAG: hypothetical protein LBT40_02055 [Deltaproteobacteria bacterium]|nr:hypothetical protein [Deltaproteobacteria bacterium]
MKTFLAAAACCLMALALMTVSASAQFELRRPQDHHKFMENEAYRSAYETCEAVLAQTLAAVTGEGRPTAETAQSEYPSTSMIHEWAQAYRRLTVAYAVAMGEKLTLNAYAPLQGYYAFTSSPNSWRRPVGSMTAVMVGDGPQYGASIETVSPDGFSCKISSAAMTDEGGKLTIHPSDFRDPDNGVIDATFNGNSAEVGPASALQMYCNFRGAAAGTYLRK